MFGLSFSVQRFKTKDRFEHFSSVLISELRDMLAIRVERENVGYLPILYGSCGVIGQSHASLHRRRREEKTFLLWWPKRSLHTKTFIFTFLDLGLFSPTYFSIDKTIHTPESTSEWGSFYYISTQTKTRCSSEDFHFYFI